MTSTSDIEFSNLSQPTDTKNIEPDQAVINIEEVRQPSQRDESHLGFRQVNALLKKNFIVKKRRKSQTICEILTPMILFSTLILGYTLSEIENIPAQIYANQSLGFTDELISSLIGTLTTPEVTTILFNTSDTVCADGEVAVAAGVCASFEPVVTGNITGINFTEAVMGASMDILPELNITTFPQFTFNFSVFPPTLIIINNGTSFPLNTTQQTEFFTTILNEVSGDADNTTSPLPNFNETINAIINSFLANGTAPDYCVPVNEFLCISANFSINSTVFGDAIGSGFIEGFENMTPEQQMELFNATRGLLAYNGIIPVISYDMFFAIHQTLEQLRNTVTRGNDFTSLALLFDPSLGNLVDGGMLFFAPNTLAVRELASDLELSSVYFKDHFYGIFNTEDEAVNFAKEYNNTLAVVVFHQFDISGGNIDYVIRMYRRDAPRTYYVVNKWRQGLNTDYRKYIFSGFLSVQKLINDYIILKASNGTVLPLPVDITNDALGLLVAASLPTATNYASVPFPTAAYDSNAFFDAAGPLVGIVLVMSMLYPVSRLIKLIVEEKENRLKETMKMMGLLDSSFAISWSLTYFIFFTFESVVMTIVFGTTVLQHVNKLLLFVFFSLFTTSLITFSFLISVFFSRAKLAAIVGPVVLYAAMLPVYAFFGSDPGYQIGPKTWTCLLSPAAASFGAQLLTDYEGAGLSLGWDGLSADDFPLITIFLMLAADIVLYGLLAWYFDKVLPNMYGIRKSPWFFIEYCFKKPASRVLDRTNENGEPDGVNFEEVSASLGPPSVDIHNLTKIFGELTAVDSLSLSMYPNQITALLGHNGAGKSTLLSILTGLYETTDGDALMDGYSIREEMDMIRQRLGICPQNNVLFDELTVQEHLELYSAIKGVSADSVLSEVIHMMHQVGLIESKGVTAVELSGGQKRRLMVGIALIGSSKIILLDEPTSGMDLVGRSHMWEMLRNHRMGKTIILTTHYIEEADLLGDRIAILDHGSLRCVGSSVFLKNHFGVGYQLYLVRADFLSNQSANRLPWATNNIKNLVSRHVPNSKCLGGAGGELAFRLPLQSVGLFAVLFRELEEKSLELEIGSHGISMTTLEEVFIRLAQEGYSKGSSKNLLRRQSSRFKFREEKEDEELKEAEAVKTSQPSILFETAVLFKKRFTCFYKDYKGIFFEILLPVLMIAFIMLMLSFDVNLSGPPLRLSSYSYPNLPVETPIAFNISPPENYISGLNWDSLILVNPIQEGTNATTLSEYMLENYYAHDDRRWAGYSFNDGYEATILFNSSSPHGLPTFIQEVSAANYRSILNHSNANIELTSFPLPIKERTEFIIKTFLTLFAALFSLVPFCYLPGTFTIFVVKERASQSKHIQLLTGVRPFVYWFSNFLWDFLLLFFVVIMCMVAFLIFEDVEFVSSWELAFATIITLLLYGFAVIPLSYCYSFFFENHSSSQLAIAGIHFIFGFVLVIASFILGSLDDTKDANETLIHFYRIFPTFDFGESLINIATLGFLNTYLYTKDTRSAFHWEVTGRDYVYLAGETIVFWIILLLIEYEFIPKLINQISDSCRKAFSYDDNVEELDEDVLRERERIIAGVNGAGKTTLLRILTGNIQPTSGTAVIKGIRVGEQFSQITGEIGYCPQSDPLLDFMTVEETLLFYARIRGIPFMTFFQSSLGISGNDVQNEVERLTEVLELEDYSDTLSQNLSGGNKRKLSIGICLVGNPAILILDEPSCGVDIISRRSIWKVIHNLTKDHSIILTSHSMEETEALCTRIAIMGRGSLKCLGTIQHLKSKFGKGYYIDVSSNNKAENIHDFINQNFEGTSMEDIAAGRYRFQLPKQEQTLSEIFGLIESNKESLSINDYAVGQSSLHQIFLTLAKQQEELDVKEEEEMAKNNKK